ncbi:MAG: type II toxin-antitoxin system RelE/ParE family toxin [Thermodesulfobacteriota bacterium]
MPKTVVRLAESALRDPEDVLRWYSERGVPEVGQRFVAELMARIEALEVHPDRGRIAPELSQPFLRELIHPPFRIVYRRDPDRVRVVRVWRSERLLKLP